MAEWSQLPGELLDLIAKHLNTSIDILRLRSVCSTWRSSVAPYPDPPHSGFPILTTDGFSYGFWGFRLSKRTIFRLGLPQPNIQTPPHSSSSSSAAAAADGWLIKIERGHVTQLLDPLSRGSIKTLPESFPRRLDLLKYRVSELGHEYILQYIRYSSLANSTSDARDLYMGKVALCSRACSGSGFDSYVLLTIHFSGQLAVFRFGERKWTIIDDLPSPYHDVILFEQKFYAVDKTGRTVVVNVDESSPVVNLIAPPVFGGYTKALVESSGELLLVDSYEHGCSDDDLGFDEESEFDVEYLGFDEESEFDEEYGYYSSGRIVRFKVFRLDRHEQKWVEVDSLGERMLFLGANCRFSASASDFSGCKGNCIFFYEAVMRNRRVARVCDLESGSIGHLTNYPDYSEMFWPPPTWVSSIMLEAGLNQLRI